MTTAHDICEALHRRYNKVSQDKEGEQYVCIEEARAGASFAGNNGQCDFLAIDTWRGHEVIGHEIKVSLNDWRRELAKPEKSELFARFCRRWYVVVPADLAAKMAHEVPPAWGLLVLSEKGRLTERQKPEPRKAEPVPFGWSVGWLAQIDRQHKRRLPQLIAAGSREAIAAAEAKVDERAERKVAHRLEQIDGLEEKVRAFSAATGIDIRHAWQGDFAKLGELWQLCRKGLDFRGVVTHLRQAADKLEAVTQQEATT